MLEDSRCRIERELDRNAVVLDIGGWADPFPRADWVVDVMPYESRGLYAQPPPAGTDPEPERFSVRTWIRRDACDREPLPFEDDSVDFVICSHTLEDVRDPIGVCREIARIGKAGYIEVPSRLEEQSWGVVGPFVGWSHHRWLIDLVGDELQFVHKPAALQALPGAQIPNARYRELSDEQKVITLFWEGGFGFRERILFDQAEHDAYLAEAPARLGPAPEHPAAAGSTTGGDRGGVRRLLRRS